MSAYKKAIDRIRSHDGFLTSTEFDSKFLFTVKPDSMARFISENGCLITTRHDLNVRYSGRDFLVNVLTEMVVIHISTKGLYSLHRWEKGMPCSVSNQIPAEKERYLIRQLFELQTVVE